jgi:membrane protein
MQIRNMFSTLKKTFDDYQEARVPQLGAALAYYSVFSLAPLLMIAIGIAGWIFGDQAARGEIVGPIESTVGHSAAKLIEDMLNQARHTSGSVAATIFGFVLALFGASGVFIQLQDSLNIIWKIPTIREQGWMWMVRQRILSFALVLGSGLLLLVLVIASTILSSLQGLWHSSGIPAGIYLWQGVNALVAFFLIALLFAVLYRVVPDTEVAWRDVWQGAFLASLMFSLGKYFIGLYLGFSSTTSAFGAAGSLVAILFWVYYSSQVLLLGAVFTHVRADSGEPPA